MAGPGVVLEEDGMRQQQRGHAGNGLVTGSGIA
jgi:hypothetical protein